MESKITKVILAGKEYLITDKQAQQILSIISSDVTSLKGRVDELEKNQNKIQWITVE
jgi:hypothetical protein